MDAQTCLKKLELICTLSMATVDRDGMPQDRIISTIHIEDNKLYFFTARGKEFYTELVESKKISVLGLSKYKEQIRLNGIPKLVPESEQEKYINIIFEKYSYLYNVYPENTNKIGAVFVIEDAQIEYFNLGVSPIFRETYIIGNYAKKKKGYMISDQCIACGTCIEKCPQRCIIKGEKYKINQDNCLHCGACFEKCPVEAVKRI